MHSQTRHIFAISVVLVIFVMGLSGCTTQQEKNDLSEDAWNFITMNVKDRLGNVSVINFPDNGAQDVTNLGDNRYQVTSYVDFKQKPGDSQRAYFYGTVIQESGSWSVDSIKLSNL